MNPASPFLLTGRVALVTGASRGLGYEIACAMARAGAHVLVNSRSPERTADVAARIRAEGFSAEPLPFDVADRAASERAFDDIQERFGRLDIFVFNVAMRMRLPLDRIATEDFQRMLDVDLTAAYTLTRRAGALMVAAGHGRIIFVTSISGTLANRNDAAYIAAKAGLTGLMRAFAFEYGGAGVTCNAIAPGAFATESNQDVPPERLERVRQRVPAGRRGHPPEIGGPAVFLASDAASYVNAHVLTVDGGYSVALQGERP
jgi:gluconate 5-dehydrogenase